MTDTKTIVRVKDIYKSYGSIKVLKGINLTIDHKEVVSIVGASGAGKTTLLKILGTIEKADKGFLSINNHEMESMGDQQLSDFRNKQIGFVFQFHHLLPEFSAEENVAIPALIARISKKEAFDRAKSLLDRFGLSHRFDHKPSELSGGEQQRVAVARALMNDPKLILADEPSGNLDSENARDLHQLFLNLRAETGKSFVIVTHNHELAQLSDRIIEMQDGKVI